MEFVTLLTVANKPPLISGRCGSAAIFDESTFMLPHYLFQLLLHSLGPLLRAIFGGASSFDIQDAGVGRA